VPGRLVVLLATVLFAATALAGVAVGTTETAGVANRQTPVGIDGPLPAPGSPTAENGSTPTIAAVYPNPVTDGDAGEFVVLSAPPGTNLGAYRLSDDDATVSLPNRTVAGRVVLSTHPNVTRPLVAGRVLPLADEIALANGGETIRLTARGERVDALAYVDAPANEKRVTGLEGRWQPLGATDRPVVTADAGEVTAFVLPDGGEVATETLSAADRRILLAGYTLTDSGVADELVAATRRNVTVRVLVDDSPVGGMSQRQATLLDRLVAAGIEVRVSGGKRARYRFHHAKYAVVDDRALVATENWKPSGLGGNSSRGWGVRTSQQPIVRGLVDTFQADTGWHDARGWTSYREGQTFESVESANGSYPTRFEPTRVPVERTRLLVAPDNAEDAVVGIIDNATETIDVQQVSIGSRHQPFLQATLSAARRGVRVRILLSSAWYVEEDNRALVAWLNDRAEAEDLPLEAAVADPRGRYEKIHTKGMVVDGDTVVLGSLNWNNNSARQNREVVLVLEGETVGAYYQRVFAADWNGGARRLPVGVVAALGAVTLGAARRGWQIRFEE
jgi:phosphatidylserine/phosphatidylglycerophosphate/cardiolipin synthase-like enzyme